MIYIVGRNDGTGRRKRFRTERKAAEYLGRKRDKASVLRGDYYLDRCHTDKRGKIVFLD